MLKNNQGNEVVADLFHAGHRITKSREALIHIFTFRRQPLSAPDLLSILEGLGLRTHKATLYRELDFLKDQRVILPVEFGDGIQRFEYIDRPHHHHAVCVQCKKIEDIELQDDVEYFENIIKSKKNFKITRHALEFFGLCTDCQ